MAQGAKQSSREVATRSTKLTAYHATNEGKMTVAKSMDKAAKRSVKQGSKGVVFSNASSAAALITARA